jgi:hypothetical protein
MIQRDLVLLNCQNSINVCIHPSNRRMSKYVLTYIKQYISDVIQAEAYDVSCDVCSVLKGCFVLSLSWNATLRACVLNVQEQIKD